MDEAKQQAFQWGGEYDTQHQWLGATTVPQESLWAFSTDNNGTWANIPENFNQNFTGLTRATWGTSTSGGNTGGFYLGGWHGQWNSPKTDIIGSYTASLGLLFYSFVDQSWNNFSTSGLGDGTYFGSVQGGSQFVPNFGASGLLVVFGGQTFSPQWLAGEPYGFDNITVFDLATKTWYSQPTSGDNPSRSRREFCNVGRQSPDGTYCMLTLTYRCLVLELTSDIRNICLRRHQRRSRHS